MKLKKLIKGRKKTKSFPDEMEIKKGKYEKDFEAENLLRKKFREETGEYAIKIFLHPLTRDLHETKVNHKYIPWLKAKAKKGNPEVNLSKEHLRDTVKPYNETEVMLYLEKKLSKGN